MKERTGAGLFSVPDPVKHTNHVIDGLEYCLQIFLHCFNAAWNGIEQKVPINAHTLRENSALGFFAPRSGFCITAARRASSIPQQDGTDLYR